jgi:hypothetical protein
MGILRYFTVMRLIYKLKSAKDLCLVEVLTLILKL